ncbi:MAG: 4'-phosphopantetheinyl transferase superfamily protein [Neisseria sp.]|nr:4'-phosphopantetheinyl transferase superfamily protein [Neisseria sp.]
MHTPPPSFALLLAAADCADGYQATLLDEADRARLARSPALAQRSDWQVSRFLKQQTALPALSLSHSRGTALLAVSDLPLTAGVDIEALKNRDFKQLSEYSCSQEERNWLAMRGWQTTDFYRLWTLKEALIKAAALDFPADLPQTGVRIDKGRLKIKNSAGRAWQGLSALTDKHAIACVWDTKVDARAEWRFFGQLAERENVVRAVWRLDAV